MLAIMSQGKSGAHGGELMILKLWPAALAVVCIALSTGLVSTAIAREELKIDAPPIATQKPANYRQVCIRKVTDDREFKDRPSNPETPSMSMGLSKASFIEKSAAIVRYRDLEGKWTDNMYLGGGDTVQSLIRQTLENVLKGQGYIVVSDPKKANPEAIIIDVSITKLWAWLYIHPGRMFVDMSDAFAESALDTTLTITGPNGLNETHPLSSRARNKMGLNPSTIWTKTFKMLLYDYSINAGFLFTDLKKK